MLVGYGVDGGVVRLGGGLDADYGVVPTTHIPENYLPGFGTAGNALRLAGNKDRRHHIGLKNE